jgi:hypothetical protein
MAEDGLGSRGVYIGTDLCDGGGSFVYDPWDLNGRALTGPGMIVLGSSARGSQPSSRLTFTDRSRYAAAP